VGRARASSSGSLARRALAAAALLGALLAPNAQAATYPPGFEDVVLAGGLSRPTAIDWLPDGRMLIAQQSGRVRVLSPGGTLAPAPLIDISDRVETSPSFGHRGLLGIAVDADFEANRYVYLLYVRKPDPPVPDGAPASSRLTRVTLAPDGTVGPETVLIGTESNGACPPAANDVDCMPADGAFHSVGTVRADADGTLWVGSGDAGVVPPQSSSEQSYAGKLLHVDRDGRGLAGHRFCPDEMDLTLVCTRIHAKGFRNPFRFTLRPDGRPLVGDVGESDREEVDVAAPGGDYGWPCYEGTLHTPAFAALPACQAEYAKEGTSGRTALEPIYEHPHDADGAAIIGGPVLEGSAFPATFEGELIVGDFIQGFLRRLELGPGGQVTSTKDFAYGWSGVDLELTPAGNLAYVDYNGGTVREIRFTGRESYAETITSTPGVVGFWRLGEGSGSVAGDELGGSAGVFSGGPGLGVAGVVAEPDTAARFDGVNDEMSVSGAALGLGSAGSLEGWFRWEAGAAPVRDSTSSGGWILAFDNGGKLAYRAGGATFNSGLATASVRDGAWHHLVLTLEGGRTGFYVDGVLVHSRTGVSAVAAKLPWHVMRNGSTAQFARGVADEVAIYDRALPAATVTDHYRAAGGQRAR
jgi:glucose/arabinose dehydrogenase